MEIRKALKLAIRVLNYIPNTKTSEGDTYDIISELESALDEDEGYFNITSISKADIENLDVLNDDLGLKNPFSKNEIDSLTDEDLENIARRMADLYVEGDYWDDLETATKEILKEKEE